MNFKKDDIIIGSYNSLGVFCEYRGNYCIAKYAIDRYEKPRYRNFLGLINPRLATKSEIKEYLSLLKRFNKLEELDMVRKIIFKDEY